MTTAKKAPSASDLKRVAMLTSEIASIASRLDNLAYHCPVIGDPVTVELLLHELRASICTIGLLADQVPALLPDAKVQRGGVTAWLMPLSFDDAPTPNTERA